MEKERKIKLRDSEKINYENIIKDTNPILREVSKIVDYPLNKENRKIMLKMIEYVRSSQDDEIAKKRNLRSAYGISAIQLGFPKKMFYVRIQDEYSGITEEFALINPEILEKDNENKCFLSSGEGCLSVDKDHKGYVYRSKSIKIRAIDYFSDREIEISAKGISAIVLQHEYDHLMGVLFYDRINKLDPYFKLKNAIKIK